MGITDNLKRWGSSIKNSIKSNKNPPQQSYPQYQQQYSQPNYQQPQQYPQPNYQQPRNIGSRMLGSVSDAGKTVAAGAVGFGAGVLSTASAKGIIPSSTYDALFIFGIIANLWDYFFYGFSVNMFTMLVDSMIFIWILVSMMRIDVKKVFLSVVLIFLIFFSDTFAFMSGGLTQQIIYVLGIVGLTIFFSKFEDPDAGILFVFFSLEVFAPKLALMFPTIIKPVFSLFLANKMIFPLWSMFAMIKGSKESNSSFINKMFFVYLIIIIFYVATSTQYILNWEANADQIINPDQRITAQENLKQAWERFKTFITFPFKAFPAYEKCKIQLDPNCTEWNALTHVNDTPPITSTGVEIPIVPTKVQMTIAPDGNSYTSNMIQTIGLPIEIKIIRGTDELTINGGTITCLFTNGTNEVYTGIMEERLGGSTFKFSGSEKEGNYVFARYCKSVASLGPGNYKLNVSFSFNQVAKSYVKLYFVRGMLPDLLGQTEKFPHYGETVPAYMYRGQYEVDIVSKMTMPISVFDIEGGVVPVPLTLLFLNQGEGILNKVNDFKLEPENLNPFDITSEDLTILIRDNQRKSNIPSLDYPILVQTTNMFLLSNNPEELRLDVAMDYEYTITKVSRFKVSSTSGLP